MFSFEEMQKEMAKKFEEINNIIEEEMEEKATMCVAEAQSRTPVKSGDLRRSMTHGEVKKNLNVYEVEVGSALEYAQAVEEGHKQEVGKYIPAIGKRLKQSFVQGRHMIGDSIEIYQRELNNSIEDRIKNEVFK